MFNRYFAQLLNVVAGNEKAIVEQLLIIFAAVAAYGIVEIAGNVIL
ncbi:hypothetical protein [Maridesulfovibrio bastinii]|jgi:hypothetical protein|nr:hypothetical protein [Maridesulfovibrio bastinii]